MKCYTTYYAVLGSVIRDARLNKNLSQEMVCDYIGLSQTTLARIESGLACTLENLCSLSSFFELHLSELALRADIRTALLNNFGVIVYPDRPSKQAQLTGIFGDFLLGRNISKWIEFTVSKSKTDDKNLVISEEAQHA